MKLVLNLFFFWCIYLSSLFAFSGVGGIGGGSSSKTTAQYVIIKMCNGGEAGNQCYEVRLNSKKFDENGNLKQPSNIDSAPCVTYEGEGNATPCKPEIEYHIPKFLEKLNDIFENQGQPIIAVDPIFN